MPPQAVEIEVFIRISVRLRELSEAVERFARESERRAREGRVETIAPDTLSELATTWNQVGEALRALPGAPTPPAGPRDLVTTIEQSLARARDIVRRQAGLEEH